MDHEDALRILHLCQEMDEGASEGQLLSVPHEQVPVGKDGKPGEPLEQERFLSPAIVADDVLDVLEEQQERVHDEVVSPPPLRPDLDSSGRMTVSEILKAIGLKPIDLLPVSSQNAIGHSLAGRDVRHLPEYFDALMWCLGAQEALRNFVDPAAFERAQEGGR